METSNFYFSCFSRLTIYTLGRTSFIEAGSRARLHFTMLVLPVTLDSFPTGNSPVNVVSGSAMKATQLPRCPSQNSVPKLALFNDETQGPLNFKPTWPHRSDPKRTPPIRQSAAPRCILSCENSSNPQLAGSIVPERQHTMCHNGGWNHLITGKSMHLEHFRVAVLPQTSQSPLLLTALSLILNSSARE